MSRRSKKAESESQSSEERFSNGYSFAAVQGIQNNREYWMTQISFNDLLPLLHQFFDRSKPESPLNLCQRTINPKRVGKVKDYILSGLSDPSAFFILPPIVITVDIPASDYYEFGQIELDVGAQTSNLLPNLGILTLPPNSTFWVPDGQHRAAGAIRARLEAPGITEDESIGIMLMPDCGRKRQQQIFLDINQNLMRPTSSIISLFDQRDETCAIARRVLTSVVIFSNRTSLEETNVRPGSGDLFTLNSLRESCGILTKGYEGDRAEMAIKFWHWMSCHHPDWKQMKLYNDLELRSKSIAFNALTLNALAILGREMWKVGAFDVGLLKRLDRIDWSIDNPDWVGLFKFDGRIYKNSKTAKSLGEYIIGRVLTLE